MRSLIWFFASLGFLVPNSFSQKVSETEVEAPDTTGLPNLVLIIADDMAWDDSAPYGHDSIMTPNLTRLANEGMRFDNAILTISSCSPSRASIITGRYPHQTDAEELHWPVPADQITFVEKLRDRGYWTGAAGKWHLGDAVRDRFDEIPPASNCPAEKLGRPESLSKPLRGRPRVVAPTGFRC